MPSFLSTTDRSKTVNPENESPLNNAAKRSTTENNRDSVNSKITVTPAEQPITETVNVVELQVVQETQEPVKPQQTNISTTTKIEITEQVVSNCRRLDQIPALVVEKIRKKIYYNLSDYIGMSITKLEYLDNGNGQFNPRAHKLKAEEEAELLKRQSQTGAKTSDVLSPNARTGSKISSILGRLSTRAAGSKNENNDEDTETNPKRKSSMLDSLKNVIRRSIIGGKSSDNENNEQRLSENRNSVTKMGRLKQKNNNNHHHQLVINNNNNADIEERNLRRNYPD